MLDHKPVCLDMSSFVDFGSSTYKEKIGELVYDVQEHGHQVRLASHANFRDFVRKEGLEFYPLGGDPKILAECMSPFSTALLVLKHSS